MNSSEIKVSVCIVTYSQEKYIRKSYEVMHISQKQKIMYYLSYIPRVAIGGIKAVLFLKKKLINE